MDIVPIKKEDQDGRALVSESSTVLEKIHLTHKWKIENFFVHTEVCQVQDSLTSSYFGSSDNQYKFFLRLFPMGKDDECRGNVSLYLQIKECPTPKVRFRVLFYIETTEGPRTCSLNRNIVSINKGGIVTASRFFAVDHLKQNARRMVPEDCLTVGCDLVIYGDSVCRLRKQTDCDVPESSFMQDFGVGLSQRWHADYKLIVGSRTFPVHKFVLCSRSPVFRAMLGHEMLESREGEANIEDMTPEAMECVINYLYTDSFTPQPGLTEKVLPAAEKYQLTRLKSMCESQLLANVDSINVCERLRLGDMYQAESLKRRAIDYIGEHSSEVLESEGWADLEADHPRLANEVLKKTLIYSGPKRPAPSTSASAQGGSSSTQPPTKRPRV